MAAFSLQATMEFISIMIMIIAISAILKYLFNHFSLNRKLPPGPMKIPIINDLSWIFAGSLSKLEPMVKSLHAKFGPIVTIHVGPITAIFISDRTLAHEALVQNGSLFADRPSKLVSNNQFNISSATYGPVWRLLRRNLTSFVHPSRMKSSSYARRRVMVTLFDCLEKFSKKGEPVQVLDQVQYSMFALLVFNCFGDKIDEGQVREIYDFQMRFKSNIGGFNLLHFWPRLTKIILYKRWREYYQLRRDQANIFLPLIMNAQRSSQLAKLEDDDNILSYVDTLLDLVIPEKGKLNDEQLISLCSEFLTSGTDSSSTALQWIMATLVKHQEIQEKLFVEIEQVVERDQELIKDDDLKQMPYLKAVVLEGLRRHPPAHMVLPHKVTRDIVLRDYLVPAKCPVNFMVAEMGWDPDVWEDPMVFKPERFLNTPKGVVSFDVTGSKEIKMMPFGVGRRMCPAYGFAMLHLEYFVANLIWKFKWFADDTNGEVNLEEKLDFTVVMKHPLRAQVSPRFNN